MKKLLFLAVACSAFQAQAFDLTGTWTSTTGTAHDSRGWRANCTEFKLVATQSPTDLNVTEGRAVCGPMTLTWDPTRFELRGTEVFFDGAQIGTLTDAGLLVEMARDGMGARIEVTPAANGAVHMVQHLSQGADFLHIETTLNRR